MAGIKRGQTLAQRFAANVAPMMDDCGCHEWVGVVQSAGYGAFRHGGVRELAHRVAYRLAYGPVPRGLHVCHRCDNPRCVNPVHLFLGTDADNARDRDAKGRQARGQAHKHAKLTFAAVAHIRASSDSLGVLARRYGVGRMTIFDVRANRSWRTMQ